MKKNSYKTADDTVISLHHVSKQYSKDAPGVLDANLEIHEGEFVFITGETGSGKSTLLKMIMRQLKATDGTIEVLGYDLNRIRHSKIPKFRRNLGIVFQDFRLLKDRDVYENVAFAQRIMMVPKNQMKHNVTSVLQMVGMADKYKRQVTQLSGGEQQRVALARALVNKPLLLLADEPTGNLDQDTAWEIMQLIDRANKETGTTVLVVTHDRGIVDRMNKRVIEMKRGEIISDTAQKIYADYEEDAYGYQAAYSQNNYHEEYQEVSHEDYREEAYHDAPRDDYDEVYHDDYRDQYHEPFHDDYQDDHGGYQDVDADGYDYDE